MKFRKYAERLREMSERIDTFLIKRLFNKYYDPKNFLTSSRFLSDYRSQENPLATSFLGWDYLLDGFGEVSRSDLRKRR